MSVRFEDRVVIVTGAGGGLGRSHALELARRGARVVVNDLGASVDGGGQDVSMADGVVREIENDGGEAIAVYDSVATPEAGAAIVQAALDRWGRVDAVVNNAGNMRPAEFPDASPEDVEALLQVHVRGAFNVTQPAFRAMRERGYGRVVFTGSSAGFFGTFGLSAYGAAKTAMLGLVNVVGQEGAAHGILVNVVLPMGRSRMGAASHVERRQWRAEMTPERQAFLDAIRPEAVSALVAYLLSEACQTSQGIFSAAAGRYARVFVGLGQGWMGGVGSIPTADDVAAHFDEIAADAPFSRLATSDDEVAEIVHRIGAHTSVTDTSEH